MIYKALQVDVEREHRYCQKVEEDFLQELNRKKPKSLEEVSRIWYKGVDGRHRHYHESRYHCLNLHSVFQKGTIEFRLFNSTTHAGKIKAYIQLCLAISAQALNQKCASRVKTASTNEKYTFRTWLLRLGMIGDEFKTARKFLLENLEGGIAWKDPEQAVRQKERLRAMKEKKELESQLTHEKDKGKLLLEQKDEQIAYYRDLKTKMSTKMVGETLEQHCEIQFNQLRATAFRNAYFEKDNDSRSGSKGDYIYRETDENGVELISIMFEMKNEMDETATKHKNEDFYKELDKDRKQKNCEYAVLVSMLESDNELFNAGIVDVSYKYEKMYVVRPQCFIPIITLLRNAAMNAMEYKQELAVVRNQNIDISDFEEKLMNFKSDFSRNYDIAHSHFDKAVDEIDKTIQHLEKVKKELLGSDNQLRIANNKVDEVSIKKLTRGNKTMQEKFEELKKNQ